MQQLVASFYELASGKASVIIKLAMKFCTGIFKIHVLARSGCCNMFRQRGSGLYELVEKELPYRSTRKSRHDDGFHWSNRHLKSDKEL